MRFKMFLTVLGLMGVGLVSGQASDRFEPNEPYPQNQSPVVPATNLESQGFLAVGGTTTNVTVDGIFYNNSQGPSFYGSRSLGSPYGLGGFEGSIHVPYNHWFGGGQGVAHPVTEEEKGQR